VLSCVGQAPHCPTGRAPPGIASLDFRILVEGEPPTPLDDEKSIHHTVAQAKARQQRKPK